MNHKALLQLGSELMHTFRHDEGPADRAMAEYVRTRQFLGASDRQFLSDVYYYALRHLLRIDEAILSAFDGTVAAETRYSSGFPINSQMGSRAWQRRVPGERQAEKTRWRPFDRTVDTLRLGLAAVEQNLESPRIVAEELERAWPKMKEKTPPQLETLERLIERAAEVMNIYRRSEKPIHQERRYSFPSWLWAMLADGRDIEEMDALGEALNQQAEGCLRVNSLKTTEVEAESALSAAGISYRQSNLLDLALVLERRVPTNSIPHFNDGWFEFQDEGSQLVSKYAAPQPGMTVVDACAGAGGKTVQMASLMKNEGWIYAFDLNEERMAQLPRRAERAGATIIDTSLKLDSEGEAPADSRLQDLDMVLIDAPCSGTGTLRRSPDIRWRLSNGYVEMLREMQKQLLDRWASRVRPGGFLVYATCSLLTIENELQIDRFLSENEDFEISAPENVEVPLTERGELKVEPHKNECDGFYAARLRKKD